MTHDDDDYNNWRDLRDRVDSIFGKDGVLARTTITSILVRVESHRGWFSPTRTYRVMGYEGRNDMGATLVYYGPNERPVMTIGDDCVPPDSPCFN